MIRKLFKERRIEPRRLSRTLVFSLAFALLLRFLGGSMYDAYVVIIPVGALLCVGAWRFAGGDGDDSRPPSSVSNEDTDESANERRKPQRVPPDTL